MALGPAARGRSLQWDPNQVVVRKLLFGAAWPWSWRKGYIRYFGWWFWGSTLIFAGVHLYNFSLHKVPYFIWPFLAVPQCFTGPALGWLRVRHGIGASSLLHATFNSGPLRVIFFILRLLSSELIFVFRYARPVPCGIVGLPNVGKSPLSNALTQAGIEADS